MVVRNDSAEREGICLGARLEETDLERMVCNRAGLPHELIQALAGDRSLPRRISIEAMILAQRVSVDRDDEMDGLPVFPGPSTK